MGLNQKGADYAIAFQEQTEAILEALGALLVPLQEIAVTLDTLNLNGATNARSILSALAANSCCPIVTGATPTSPLPPWAGLCQQTQNYLHKLWLMSGRLADKRILYGATITPAMVKFAIDEVPFEAGAFRPTDTAVLQTLAAAYNNATTVEEMDAGSLLQTDLAAPLRVAIGNASNSQEAHAAAQAVIDEYTDIGANGKAVLKALLNPDAVADMFTDVDEEYTGYDSGLCAIDEGFTCTGVLRIFQQAPAGRTALGPYTPAKSLKWASEETSLTSIAVHSRPGDVFLFNLAENASSAPVSQAIWVYGNQTSLATISLCETPGA